MKKVSLLLLWFGLSQLAFSQTSIVLEKNNGTYKIPCNVNGLNMSFVFDTGASDVTLSTTEAVFMIKNGYLSLDDIFGSTKYQIANGKFQEGTLAILRHIEIAGYHLYNVKASIIHSPNAPLLLGQSALSKLGSFQFDYDKGKLTILNSHNDNVKEYGCVWGDCVNGSGKFVYSDGSTYEGEFENGMRYGNGKQYFGSDIQYAGQFKDDEFNGKGVLIFSNGNIYVGEFKNGEYHGLGRLQYFNDEKYEGQFIEGNFNGRGTYIWPNGNRYEGSFVNGKCSGRGKFVTYDGQTYAGIFKNDQYIGK